MKIDITFEGKKQVNASFNGYTVKTDQRADGGGEGLAPSPFELFLASIATCAGVYVKSFCDQRSLPTDNIKITQDIEYNNSTKMVDVININIAVPQDFPEKYIDSLINVANLCTVKKHLHNPPQINVVAGRI